MKKNKKIAKELNEKHKGFKFAYDGTILSLEVKLPFRVMVMDTYGNKHCDDETYSKIQFELRRKLHTIDNTKTITIVECGFIQYFTSNIDKIEDVVEEIKRFIVEKTELYGKYIKRGYECNKTLLKDLGMSDAKPAQYIKFKSRKRVAKPVLQYSLNGEFIKEWNSVYDAAEAVSGVWGASGNIFQCCKGNYKTAYGYVWRYKD